MTTQRQTSDTTAEIWPALPLEQHATYVAEHAHRFWRVGKSSPVHFFWGSFDLALTRFSNRPAPPHPGS